MTRKKIRQRLQDFLEQQPQIIFAYLHGSFVAGPAFHDIDVALYLDPPAADPFEYEMSTSVVLTRVLHVPVDVRLLNGAALGFQHQVLQGELIFTRDEVRLTDFIEHVANEYTAFSHYLPAYLKAVTT